MGLEQKGNSWARSPNLAWPGGEKAHCARIPWAQTMGISAAAPVERRFPTPREALLARGTV